MSDILQPRDETAGNGASTAQAPDLAERLALALFPDGPPLERWCSWCDTQIAPGIQPRSHGICAGCAAAMRAKRAA